MAPGPDPTPWPARLLTGAFVLNAVAPRRLTSFEDRCGYARFSCAQRPSKLIQSRWAPVKHNNIWARAMSQDHPRPGARSRLAIALGARRTLPRTRAPRLCGCGADRRGANNALSQSVAANPARSRAGCARHPMADGGRLPECWLGACAFQSTAAEWSIGRPPGGLAPGWSHIHSHFNNRSSRPANGISNKWASAKPKATACERKPWHGMILFRWRDPCG